MDHLEAIMCITDHPQWLRESKKPGAKNLKKKQPRTDAVEVTQTMDNTEEGSDENQFKEADTAQFLKNSGNNNYSPSKVQKTE